MYTNLFCNILSQALSTGSISLNLQSFNASANVNLTLTASGLTAGMAPDVCAQTIITQFNTQLTQYGINFGVPQITGEIPAALFRLTRTEHIINFFSECQFDVTITVNSTGAQVEVSHEPILATLDDFSNLSSLMAAGATLTDAEKILLLKVASGLITSYTNNLLVQAGYVQSFNGFYQRSFFLNLGLPVQAFDPPRIAPPSIGMYAVWTLWFLVYPWLRWNLNPITGELFFQPNNNLINNMEPSSLNNQIKVSYQAGEWKIPPAVLLCLAQLCRAIINDPNGAKSIKTGSFSVTLREKTPIQMALALMDNYII